MNFEKIDNINTNKSFIIHFRYKSTEEFINKYKRGYINRNRKFINLILKEKLSTYFQENNITLEKINYIEKALKLNLTSYRNKLQIISSNNSINPSTFSLIEIK